MGLLVLARAQKDVPLDQQPMIWNVSVGVLGLGSRLGQGSPSFYFALTPQLDEWKKVMDEANLPTLVEVYVSAWRF